MGAQDLIALMNAGVLQSDRIVKLDTPAGPNVLLPHIVVGTAHLGGNFEISVDVVSLQDSIELKSLIAQPVTLWIQQSDKTYRPRHGYVHTARRLGADCAFFIENKPVFAFEKGDRFEDIRLDLSGYRIALVMPPAHVSTAEAYRGVRPTPVMQSLKDLIQLPVAEWKHHIKNDFEESVFKNHPVIRGVKAALYEAGAIYASMSGSGASVFGIFNKKSDLSELEKTNQVFYLCRISNL